MLKFENVSLKYGSFLALDQVSLHADQGELVVLLGANGAGKSSLFLTASGIHKAAGGSITWNGQGEAGRMPYNLKTGDPYSGVNVLSLWIGAESQGYTSPAWLTFKQAIDLGGHVRKGEKSVLGIYFEARERKETNSSGEEETRRVPFVKTFHVFNLDQVEGIPKPEPFAIWNPLERAEEVMRNSGASIIEGGTRARSTTR